MSGRSAKNEPFDVDNPNRSKWRSLSAEDHEIQDALGLGRWDDPDSISGYVVSENNESNAGMVAHRGVLSEREFEVLDWRHAEQLVVAKLGATREEIETAYRDTPGKPSAEVAEMREFLDGRFLAIQEAGGNMLLLATVLAWPIDQRRCKKIERAIARARSRREES